MTVIFRRIAMAAAMLLAVCGGGSAHAQTSDGATPLDLRVSASIVGGRLVVRGHTNLPDGYKLRITAMIVNPPGPQEKVEEEGTRTGVSPPVVVVDGAFRAPPLACATELAGVAGPFDHACIPGDYWVEVAGPVGSEFQPDGFVNQAYIGDHSYSGNCLVFMPMTRTWGIDCTRTVMVGHPPKTTDPSPKRCPFAPGVGGC